MKKFLGILCFLAFTSAGYAEETTRLFTSQSVPLPAIALLDDVSALPFNPAGAGARDLFEIYLSKSLNPLNPNQFSIFAGIPNLSWGYQQFQAGILGELRRFSTAVTYPLQDFLSLGLAYHLTQETALPNSQIHSFDLGLQFRPVRYLSLGASVRNLNAPQVANQRIRRSYTAGLGIRPFGERLTLTADAQWDEGDDVKAITGLFGLESEPIDGLILRGSVDLKAQFMLGLALQFNHFNLGYFHSLNAPIQQDAAHIKLSNTTFHSALEQWGNHFAYINLHQGLLLDSGEDLPPWIQRHQPVSYWHFLEQLRWVETMPRYKGVVIDISSLRTGLGTIEEIHQALRRVRSAGKRIIVYLKDASMAEHYLASLADKIVMHPLGSLNMRGFAYILPHYQELLERWGIEVEFIKVGQYKTGLEAYTQKSPSAATLEQYTSIQKDDFERYVANLKATRHLNDTMIQKIFNQALFNPQEAKAAGLVDAVVYPDEVPELAANLIHQPQSQFENISQTRFAERSWEPKDKIAVLYISGNIVTGPSGRGFFWGEEFTGSDSVVEQIHALRRNPQVKALVVRINSPGGSALAADEIYRALQQYKKRTGHPVIISMADIAASGGYWIALAGDKILANASTLTGSIGIYAGKLNLKGLFDQLGIRNTVIKSSEKADLQSEHRGYTEAERQMIQNNLRDYYRIFLERVSENRRLDISTVEQLAQGRVYTGKQAQQLQLIDQLGGLSEAITLARSQAKVQTHEIAVEHFPKAEALLSHLLLGEPTQAWWPHIRATLERLFPSQYSILALVNPEVLGLSLAQSDPLHPLGHSAQH